MTWLTCTGTAAPQAPFHASTGLLAALARSPEREIPGLRLTLRPEFDVTPGSGRQAQARQESAASGWDRCWTGSGWPPGHSGSRWTH